MFKTFFAQPVKNYLRTYDNILKITISQGHDYKIGCLLDYLYFKESYKIIAIALSEQQVLDTDPIGTHKNNFTTMFFITEYLQETILEFSQGTVTGL